MQRQTRKIVSKATIQETQESRTASYQQSTTNLLTKHTWLLFDECM